MAIRPCLRFGFFPLCSEGIAGQARNDGHLVVERSRNVRASDGFDSYSCQIATLYTL